VLGLLVSFVLALGPAVVFPDSWLGLAGGRELAQHGFSTVNSWTRFGSHEWVNQQWAAHLAFYGVWSVGGALALVALNITLVLSGLGLCIRAALRRGASPAWTALVLAVVLASDGSAFWYGRAQSFSILCFGVLVWILTRDDGRLDRGVFLTLPLLVVWTNLHAAVLVGAAMCVVYAGSCCVESGASARVERGRALWLAAGACLACLATPMALGLPWYVQRTMGNADFARHLPEWAPTTLSDSPIYVLGALAAVAITTRAHLPRRDALLVWALTLAGFGALRSQLWASLVWLVVLPGALESLRPVVAGLRLRRAAFLLALLVCFALTVAVTVDVRDGGSEFARAWPRPAAQIVRSELRRDPTIDVFADQPLADWLLYTVPAVRGRLAIDGRFEVFDHRTFEDVFGLEERPIRISRRIQSEDLYVLSPTPTDDRALVRVLERTTGIVELYRSATVVVLKRL
jgi:hypothetical protein